MTSANQGEYFYKTLLTPTQVANLLSVSKDTLSVWRCVKRHNLPYVKVGRLVRYKPSDVDSFIKSRTVMMGYQ